MTSSNRIPVKFIPCDGGGYYAFAPKHRLAFRCDESDKNHLEVGMFSRVTDWIRCLLRDVGVISKNVECVEECNMTMEKRYPRVVTFLMTSSCNMKCSYCYATTTDLKNLTLSRAREHIDYVFDQVHDGRTEEVKFKFHGVGEPTMVFDDVIDIVKYVKSKGLERGIACRLSLTTNGYFEEEVRHQVAKWFDHVTVSFDGTPDMNRISRPTKDGSDASNVIVGSIKYFVRSNIGLACRQTVTSLTVNYLQESVQFLSGIGVKNIFIEPVSMVGAALNSDLSVDPESFLDNYFSAKQVAEQSGAKLLYSGGTIKHAVGFHCGAYGSNYVVTPSGEISLCYEVHEPKHELYSLLVADSDTSWRDLSASTDTSAEFALPDECLDCYAVFNCGGGCLARRRSSNDESRKSFDAKCEINRAIIAREVRDCFKDSQQPYCYI